MVTEVTPDAYGVWDTEGKRWWKRRNKHCWGSKAAAANAWNAEQGYGYRDKTVLFSKQHRYVTRGIIFIDAETGSDLK